MESAVATHTKGVESWLYCSVKAMMARFSWVTLQKLPA